MKHATDVTVPQRDSLTAIINRLERQLDDRRTTRAHHQAELCAVAVCERRLVERRRP